MERSERGHRDPSSQGQPRCHFQDSGDRDAPKELRSPQHRVKERQASLDERDLRSLCSKPPLALYIVTDRRSKKARNIGRNPNVAFVMPVPRSPASLSPGSIQFQGTAEIVPVTDETAQKAFNASFVRMILKAQFAQKRELSIFVRIRPDALVFTYGVGATLFRLMKHVEGAFARVEIPAARLEQGTGPET